MSAAGPGNHFRHLAELVADVGRDVRARHLEGHVYELELNGYTVVEDAVPAPARAELTSALLTAAAEDDDAPVDPGGTGHRDRTQEVVLLLARGGRPFEELVMCPTTLALVTYLLGPNATLSSVTGYLKGQGDTALGVHSDTAYVPDPLPPYAQLANVNYCLTDYTEAGGCLTVVPGSHRYGHRPRGGDGAAEAVPVEAPAGAAIVFHGNTWHGARPRSAPGLRLTLSTLFCRMYMRPQERYEDLLSEEVLCRNPDSFGRLVGREVPTGWRSRADAERIVALRRDHAATYYRTRGQHG